MIILGIIFTVAGIAGISFARTLMSSYEYKAGSFFGTQDSMEIDMIQMGSYILLALGIIFVIIGIVRMATKRHNQNKIQQPTYYPPVQPQIQPQVQSPAVQQTMAACTSCGQAINANSSFCRSCGAKRDNSPVQSNFVPEAMVACSACGNTIESNSAFCRFCGAKRT